MDKSTITASKEVIWHLTCGECHYYWTYPTMQMAEDVEGKVFYCPLCGVQSKVSVDDSV